MKEFIQTGGVYNSGTAWNGLSTVTESPSGAEPTAIYADNIKYLNLMSAEEFGGTIEAYMAPDEFAECDGSKEIAPGVFAGQQNRKMFGLSYKTLLGNDVDSNGNWWGNLCKNIEKYYCIWTGKTRSRLSYPWFRRIYSCIRDGRSCSDLYGSNQESSCYIECKNIIIKSGSSVRRVLLILLFHRKFHFQCY